MQGTESKISYIVCVGEKKEKVCTELIHSPLCILIAFYIPRRQTMAHQKFHFLFSLRPHLKNMTVNKKEKCAVHLYAEAYR